MSAHLLPALPAHLWLWAVRAVVAFLAAVETLAGLVISSTITGSRTVPGYHIFETWWPAFFAAVNPIGQHPIMLMLKELSLSMQC